MTSVHCRPVAAKPLLGSPPLCNINKIYFIPPYCTLFTSVHCRPVATEPLLGSPPLWNINKIYFIPSYCTLYTSVHCRPVATEPLLGPLPYFATKTKYISSHPTGHCTQVYIVGLLLQSLSWDHPTLQQKQNIFHPTLVDIVHKCTL